MQMKVAVPELGESVLEATVVEWLKNEGDQLAAGEALVALETSKVTIEVAAEQAGKLVHIEHRAGEDVRVGQVLAWIETDEKTPRPASALPGAALKEENLAPEAPQAREPEGTDETSPTPAKAQRGPEMRATPVAQRLARDLGVDLSQVPGSGPAGRTTRNDVEAYFRQSQAPAPPSPSAGPETGASPSRPEQHLKMSRRRRTIAARLVEAQRTAAILTTFNEVDMSAVMALRQKRQESFLARFGVKLGITSFFVKAAIGALKAYRQVNAEIRGDEIILKDYYDIGIAVGAAEGLVVPVIRDADRLSIAAIELQIKEFARKAEAKSFSLEDLRGGTFTITNGGVFGSLFSTPILNPPQAGILGLHKIEPRPVAVQEAVAIRPMMYVALSYDHRIVDGLEAVQFLVRVKQLIEEPDALLLEA